MNKKNNILKLPTKNIGFYITIILITTLFTGCFEDEPIDKQTWLTNNGYIPLKEINGTKSNWKGQSITFDSVQINITTSVNETINQWDLPISFHVIQILDYETNDYGVPYIKYHKILPTQKLYNNLKAHIYQDDVFINIVGLFGQSMFRFNSGNCPGCFPIHNSSLVFDVVLVLDVPIGFEIKYYFNPWSSII